jgi:hypothetical protein
MSHFKSLTQMQVRLIHITIQVSPTGLERILQAWAGVPMLGKPRTTTCHAPIPTLAQQPASMSCIAFIRVHFVQRIQFRFEWSSIDGKGVAQPCRTRQSTLLSKVESTVMPQPQLVNPHHQSASTPTAMLGFGLFPESHSGSNARLGVEFT